MCDLARENRPYVHTKVCPVWILKFHNFVPKHSLLMKLMQLVAIAYNGEYNAIYRFFIAHTKGDHEISVFCTYTYFLIPGHILLVYIQCLTWAVLVQK